MEWLKNVNVVPTAISLDYTAVTFISNVFIVVVKVAFYASNI